MAAEVYEIGIGNELDNLNNDRQESIDCDLIGSLLPLNRKHLNIVHFNIRCMYKNFNELVSFLQTYKLTFCDIIILSECWHIDNTNLFNIRNYNIYYNHGDINKNDGMLIYVNENINTKLVNIKLKKSGVTISKINLTINSITYGITCGYRPPSSNMHYFLEDIDRFFSDNLNGNIELFIGDININILNKNDIFTNQYLSLVGSYGFEATIKGPTRVTLNSATCLDHIFIRSKLKSGLLKFDSFILNGDLTDHFPIMINFYGEQAVGTRSKLISKIVENINLETLGDHFDRETWAHVINNNDAESATDNFITSVRHYIELSKEKRTVYFRDYNKLKPWITNGIIAAIKRRDKMKKYILINKNAGDTAAYKTYRNNLNKIIQKQKYEFYKNKIENNKNNLKKIYEIVSEAVDEKKCGSVNNFEILDDRGNSFSNKKDMANYCNKFFTEIGTKMHNKIVTPDNMFQINHNSMSSMFLKPVDKNEIIGHINSLKNNCAPGYDGVESRIIKYFHLHLINPLVHLINIIFRTGVVPSGFKKSIVTPIFKDKDKTKITNFRPISVISNFAKVFEKCLRDRLSGWLLSNNILSKNQFGFCNGLSTSDAIYELTKNVTNNLDSGNKCLAVFLDLAKAFDTVPHDSLLNVLNIYGVRGAVLRVFQNYLCDRSQIVRIQDTYSEPLAVRIGIPQGTVLGPLLFIAYINSLTSITIENGLVISYADDTVIVFRAKTWNEVRNFAEMGISKIKNWLDSFKLTLNVDKTNYIAFSLTAANRPPFNNILVNGFDKEIKEVSSTKYLGIIIDKNLKWKEHVSKVTNNIRALIRKFYSLREILCTKLLICVYKALVESLLGYGVVVWGGLYKNSLHQLEIIQKYILKIIFKKGRRYPTRLLFCEDIVCVRSLYILSICTFVHKKNCLRTYVDHAYATRTKVNRHLAIPNSNTNINLRFINYLAPRCYNLLPGSMKLMVNHKKFRTVCKSYIFRNLQKFMILF